MIKELYLVEVKGDILRCCAAMECNLCNAC